jgi:hypothetical protein
MAADDDSRAATCEMPLEHLLWVLADHFTQQLWFRPCPFAGAFSINMLIPIMSNKRA